MNILIQTKKITLLAQQVASDKNSIAMLLRMYAESDFSQASMHLFLRNMLTALESQQAKLDALIRSCLEIQTHNCGDYAPRSQPQDCSRSQDLLESTRLMSKKLLHESQLEIVALSSRKLNLESELQSQCNKVQYLEKCMDKQRQEGSQQIRKLTRQINQLEVKLAQQKGEVLSLKEQLHCVSESKKNLETLLAEGRSSFQSTITQKLLEIDRLRETLAKRQSQINRLEALVTEARHVALSEQRREVTQLLRQVQIYKQFQVQVERQLTRKDEQLRQLQIKVSNFEYMDTLTAEKENELASCLLALEGQKGQLQQEVHVLSLELRETRGILHGYMRKAASYQ